MDLRSALLVVILPFPLLAQASGNPKKQNPPNQGQQNSQNQGQQYPQNQGQQNSQNQGQQYPQNQGQQNSQNQGQQYPQNQNQQSQGQQNQGQQGAPPSEVVPNLPKDLYSLDVNRQDISVVLKEFAHRTGVPMTILEMPTQLVTLSFKNLPFERALAAILTAGALDQRVVDGAYVVGMPVDLKVRYPQPNERELDATYRCRRVGAQSLATTLSNLLPGLKVGTGPLFLSPELNGGGSTGSDSQVKAISATDASFRTHDVVISGPADLVRRALTLCQKFDRPRKQVRISVRIVTIDKDASSKLGVDWATSLSMTFTEQPRPTADGTAPPSGTLVDGIRLGRFSHSPLVVTSTLNALETQGRSKTLSNPTLTLLDGERSFILNGQKYIYPVYKGRDQSGLATYDVTDTKVGVYLQVGVQVGLDNDMILSLYPQVTALGGFTKINDAEYPNIFTSEEQTTVKAVSGEVLVLGGMALETNSSARTGLPFLGRVPLLGKLFSKDTRDSAKSELMIILTPTLVEETVPKAEVNLAVTAPQE